MKKTQTLWFPASLLVFQVLSLLPLLSSADKLYNHIVVYNHMVVHDSTGRIYIGAVNRIYQFAQDLSLEAVAIMGPQHDSPNCPATKICPNEHKTPTDYYNKALLIDSSQNKLIACGSLFQGICTVHDLNNVTIYETPTNEAVVANSDRDSTVAFIAPGPEVLNLTHVLYVGVTYTNNGHYRSDVPAVCTRSLQPSEMFAAFYNPTQTHDSRFGSFRTSTRAFVNSMFIDSYPITYVYGFGSEGFSYFVTVQKQSTEPSSRFFSKLVRVCQNDVDYYSYTEVPLVCKADNGVDYNLAQAAYYGKPGSQLAESLGITERDSVLFVAFSESTHEEEGSNEPGQNSALCVYTLPNIRREFWRNIQHCFSGNGERGFDYMSQKIQCVRLGLIIDEDFCGLDVNSPLDGTMPIQASPILTLPGILLTSVVATSIHEYTVTFLGTSTGHLKRIVVETATTASEYSDIVIEEGSPVNADMAFDKTKDHIYVMTKRRVTKVKVQECEAFETYADCLAAHDPYCGWCSLENKCMSRNACAETAHDSLCWSSYKSSHCYTFTASPVTGRSKSHGSTSKKAEQDVERLADLKIRTLQDIAHSMSNIDSSLKELVELQKQK